MTAISNITVVRSIYFNNKANNLNIHSNKHLLLCKSDLNVSEAIKHKENSYKMCFNRTAVQISVSHILCPAVYTAVRLPIMQCVNNQCDFPCVLRRVSSRCKRHIKRPETGSRPQSTRNTVRITMIYFQYLQ